MTTMAYYDRRSSSIGEPDKSPPPIEFVEIEQKHIRQESGEEIACLHSPDNYSSDYSERFTVKRIGHSKQPSGAVDRVREIPLPFIGICNSPSLDVIGR